jgi:hypothetical protein
MTMTSRERVRAVNIHFVPGYFVNPDWRSSGFKAVHFPDAGNALFVDIIRGQISNLFGKFPEYCFVSICYHGFILLVYQITILLFRQGAISQNNLNSQ